MSAPFEKKGFFHRKKRKQCKYMKLFRSLVRIKKHNTLT